MSISWSLHETKCHIFLNSLKIPFFINTFKKINVNLSTKEKKKKKKKSMFHEHPMCLGAKVHELKKILGDGDVLLSFAQSLLSSLTNHLYSH